MKEIRVKSVAPIYLAALVWPIFGAIWPLYSAAPILVCAALSAAAYLLGGAFFKGRTVEVELPPDTGDIELDRIISEGRAQLRILREARDAPPIPEVAQSLRRMEEAASKIFAEIERDSRKAYQARKFLNYYLPKAAAFVGHHRALAGAGGGENVAEARERVERGFELIARAFEKQFDNLYEVDALDIAADLQVLETMMAGEGLVEGGYSIRTPRGAE